MFYYPLQFNDCTPLSIVLTRLTDSLTDSPDAVAIQTATVPMLPLRGRCRWRPVAVGASSPVCRARTQPLSAAHPLLLSVSALSVVLPSKLITRAALSARRLSRRGLGLCLRRRVKFTTALPLGVSLSQTPHRAH